MYKADLQCRYQFNSTDEEIKVCSKLEEICSQLWCSVNGVCTTLLRPAAPGTKCGKHLVNNFLWFVSSQISNKFNFSGVRINSVSKSKIFLCQFTEDGEIGVIGANAVELVVQVFRNKRGNVTIHPRVMAEIFVRASDPDIRFATHSHAVKSFLLIELSSVPILTECQWKEKITLGYLTLTLVSWLILILVKYWFDSSE